MKARILLALLCVLPALAAANVNPKNGNFYLTYQDMLLKAGDRELPLRRTFNSKSVSHKGWFGWGWNSPYETRLHPMPDGSVLVRESGAGLMHFYDPVKGAKQHQAGLDAIVAAAKVADKLDDPRAAHLRAALDADEEQRGRTAVRLDVRGKVPPGTRFDSRMCGALERIAEGWRRNTCIDDKAIEYFDDSGALLRSEDARGFVNLTWKDGRLESVKDSSGLAFHYTWTPQGQVAAVQGSSGDTVRYVYSEAGDLVASEGKTVAGERMTFTYDAAHRMTRALYIDTTSEQVSYGDDGLVRERVNRVGTRQTFEYGGSDRKYWTRVREFAYGGQLSGERTIEYDIAASDTGEHAVNRIVITEGGRRFRLNPFGMWVEEDAGRLPLQPQRK
jgi:YD repeat-containing protein